MLNVLRPSTRPHRAFARRRLAQGKQLDNAIACWLGSCVVSYFVLVDGPSALQQTAIRWHSTGIWTRRPSSSSALRRSARLLSLVLARTI